MPRNGSGTFTLYPGVNPVVTGTTITSSWANNTLGDIATALSASISNDGQTTILANLPMATFRHTGVGNAVARTDYAAAGQVQDSTFLWGGTAGGTADALTISVTPAITAYAAGQAFEFIVGASPNATTTPTLAVSGLSPVTFKRKDGTTIAAGDLPAGMRVRALHDGTNFRLDYISPVAPTFSGNTTVATINKVTITTPATGSTLTIADGKTLTASNTLTFTGTDSSSVAFGAGGTVLYSGGALGTPSSGTLTNCTFPTLNQNTTGSAAKWTTARNLAGNSVDGSANVAFANKFVVQGTADSGLSGAQFLGALATGIVKNTTSTGVLSIATAGTDYSAGTGALATGILKSTTSTGALSIATGADLPVMTSTVGGAVPTPPNNTNTYLRGDGTFATPSVTSGLTLITTLTPTAAATVDALSSFSSSYDNVLIVAEFIGPGIADTLNIRFANGGVVDTGNHYGTPINANATSATPLSFANSSIPIQSAGNQLSGTVCNFCILIQNVNDTVNAQTINWRTIYAIAGPAWRVDEQSTVYNGGKVSGIRFFWGGGNNFSAGGKIRIYGYQNS